MPDPHRHVPGRRPAGGFALRRSLVAGLSWLAISVCAAAEPEASLAARLGGPAALAEIAAEVVDMARADPTSARHFTKVNLPRLKSQIGIQLCALAGGPCRFDGDDMKATHAGLGIDEGNFHRMVEHLRLILDARGVGIREKNELLALLAPMKRDVVTR